MLRFRHLPRLRSCLRQFATASPSEAAPVSRNAKLLQKIREQQQLKAATLAKESDARMKTLTNEWTPRQLRWNLALWGAGFFGFVWWAAIYGRSVQLKTSPLFKGVMFTLRQDPKVRKWIGDSLESSNHVNGFINHIKGRAEISFDITGTSGKL